MALFLIIEEDRDSQLLIKRVLAKEGHRVAAFSNICEASVWLKENSPDLVIANAGRSVEDCGRSLSLLKSSGVEGSRLVLTTGIRSMDAVKKACSSAVREVVARPLQVGKLVTMGRSFPAG
jgi:DNA-binding NtrC family response regulator